MLAKETPNPKQGVMSLSQPMPKAHKETKSQKIEKMFQELAALQFILYIRIKRGDIR